MVQFSGQFQQFTWAKGAKQAGAVSPPGHGTLVPGVGVSVQCERQSPRDLQEHRHTAALLLFGLESAEGLVSWRSKRHGLRRESVRDGQFLVIPSGLRHARRWLSEAVVLILHLHTGWMEQFDRNLLAEVRVESVQHVTLHDPLVGDLTAKIQDHCETEEPAHRVQIAALGQCLAARVMHFLNCKQSLPRVAQRRLGQETLDRVCSHVTTNLSERIPLAAMAREARLSPGHFSVLFKATMGMNPEQYVLRMRLLRAKDLIKSGAYTVSQVAHMTGFSDHSHLTLQFGRLFGSPPRCYLPAVRTA
jgi:AraC family transcriptional regulator